jgi:hypothetical protein
VSELALWRVEPLSAPPLFVPCPCCHRISRFECAERFRVNAQQARLDVWLLYRCAACDHTTKRRLLRRAPVGSLAPARLEGYLRDDAELVRRHAFELPVTEALAYRVVRPTLPGGDLVARIVQPWPCGVRWDRFLARELGVSRSRVAADWRSGVVRVDGVSAPARIVAAGQVLRLAGGDRSARRRVSKVPCQTPS